MIKRFSIICSIIGMALLTLSIIGLSSLGMHARALQSERQQEFISVAKKVRFDIKTKLDNFLQAEQQRPYTDYQYYYAPMTTNKANAVVRSPLADKFSNGLAKGYFQLDSQNNIINPYTLAPGDAPENIKEYLSDLASNLLPTLGKGSALQVARIEPADEIGSNYSQSRQSSFRNNRRSQQNNTSQKVVSKINNTRSKRYEIELENNNQAIQTQNVNRDNTLFNVDQQKLQNTKEDNELDYSILQYIDSNNQQNNNYSNDDSQPQTNMGMVSMGVINEYSWDYKTKDNIIQARIEPFVPITLPAEYTSDNFFAGQVFMIRHVQIEKDHFLQGFKLDENELIRQVKESVDKLLLRGMGYEISKHESQQATYTAVLDFGFGELALNLMELQPEWVSNRVTQIRNWFFTIMVIVWLAVSISLAMFWRNMQEQAQLAHKKDDFISAVSHELRTPLTSIRMYTEMLEKNWVKNEEKRQQYIINMRQESERLARLVENVLDFSRIQRGKKRYEFVLGNINNCIENTVKMMIPYAQQAGFTINTDYATLQEFAFDQDAIVQIVINLIDNSLKYAKNSSTKEILVKTNKIDNYITIEIQDNGPGIIKNHQKKIFEEFYRCGDESTRQETGTGLGLALVKRFAEAHKGYVEYQNNKPTGAIFKVCLAAN